MADGITVVRTWDYALIKKLATDPSIFPWISDDFHKDPENWEPIQTSLVRYLIASDVEGSFGFGIFIPDTWACWKGHLGFLPRSYGEKAIESFRRMLDWMWTYTSAERLVGEIAQENRRALNFVVRAGLTPYGINQKSFRRDGRLQDQVCVGISKPL